MGNFDERQWGISVSAVSPPHDAWAPYDTYTDAAHQLCGYVNLKWPHRDDANWPHLKSSWSGLADGRRLVTEALAAGVDTLDEDALTQQVHRYRCSTQTGLSQTATRSDKLMKKHNALARRLIDRQDDYLRFTTDWRIPPDNNGSERDIRMIKVRQKVSGCLRTLTGAKQFCAARSYLSTAAKNGRPSFDALVMLAEGRPWLPA
ncbi:IS66 family transposase [Candidatus Mycobacterium methanotrophicum]|uniref:Transposase n=1 Tax=Candidatus Mycobacterium methanotrophicum TaxID=2943498 RepID=A0ABY4QRR6_9MYCO|nr:transposase [Candidatus Mycobacterium methanotrophicum]UQX13633.1 transposase [Candidatus Mycobacterium methanotrophicum]